jgi:hypothetical protein
VVTDSVPIVVVAVVGVAIVVVEELIAEDENPVDAAATTGRL